MSNEYARMEVEQAIVSVAHSIGRLADVLGKHAPYVHEGDRLILRESAAALSVIIEECIERQEAAE